MNEQVTPPGYVKPTLSPWERATASAWAASGRGTASEYETSQVLTLTLLGGVLAAVVVVAWAVLAGRRAASRQHKKHGRAAAGDHRETRGEPAA